MICFLRNKHITKGLSQSYRQSYRQSFISTEGDPSDSAQAKQIILADRQRLAIPGTEFLV